jgi:hypothetical protein
MKRLLIGLIVFFMTLAYSYGQTVLVRPNAAIGYFSAGDVNGLAYNYGFKALLSSNEFQRYGILADHLIIPGSERVSYLRTGIIIEQVLFGYFNTGIGTIGYINLVHAGQNSFGLYTHLGFEYKFTSRFNIVSSYQSDFIFRRHFSMYNAFLLGFGVQF